VTSNLPRGVSQCRNCRGVEAQVHDHAPDRVRVGKGEQRLRKTGERVVGFIGAFVVLDVERLRVRQVFKPIGGSGMFVAQPGWNRPGVVAFTIFRLVWPRPPGAISSVNSPPPALASVNRSGRRVGDFFALHQLHQIRYRGLWTCSQALFRGNVRRHRRFGLLGVRERCAPRGSQAPLDIPVSPHHGQPSENHCI